jgi:hypothetical protein
MHILRCFSMVKAPQNRIHLSIESAIVMKNAATNAIPNPFISKLSINLSVTQSKNALITN